MKITKQTTRKAWTEQDNKNICELYSLFHLYQSMGTKYSKAPIVRQYAEEMKRSKGSIECKLMNISAIRQELSLDIVKGYKALSNYNKDLKIAYLNSFELINELKAA